jgi:hypothetical protein
MMRNLSRWIGLYIVFQVGASVVSGDGGLFYRELEVSHPTQTRQEVLLAVHGDNVTYALRTRYEGQPTEFAWVLPVPATPTDVVAHQDSSLFDTLDEQTRPRFFLMGGMGAGPFGMGIPCGCAAGGMAAGEGSKELETHVEASGTAGVFDWAALSSTGSDSLEAWLRDNGFAVPETAGPILDRYIQQDSKFLAVRVHDPDALQRTGQTEVPPIQFTCQTTRRWYPMVISKVSAAAEIEVIVYVFADKRAEAANVPTVAIDRDAVKYDPKTATVNYNQVFDATIAQAGNMALVTEFTTPFGFYRSDPRPQMSVWYAALWPEAPADVAGQAAVLTRLRTLVGPAQIAEDFEFRDAASTEQFALQFDLWASAGAGTSLAVLALVTVCGYSAFAGLVRRHCCRLRKASAGGGCGAA